MSTTSLLAGVAGEYFVAAELSRRGFIASITLRNTRGIDIVVANKDATKTVTIQCKPFRQKMRQWTLTGCTFSRDPGVLSRIFDIFDRTGRSMDSNRSVFYSRWRGHYPLVFTR